MDRIVEPEIMSDPDQVQAYYDTDREQYKYLFKLGYVSTKKQVRQNKSLIDKVSATLLLQSFITHQQAKTS